jgi:prephenate dehydrogenase
MSRSKGSRSKNEPTDAARMPVIAIVGLDGRGVALGQALQQVKTRFALHGHDREPARVRAALGAGAIDHGQWSVAELAASADLIFLAESGDANLETLAVIAPHVRPGTLVTTLGPAMQPACRRAAELLPPGVSFIAAHPVLRLAQAAQATQAAQTAVPAASSSAAANVPSASGAVFRGATFCLAPLPTASDSAVRVLRGLVADIGATPYFIDPAEHDGLVAGVGVMPYVLATALLRVADRSPSARDLRRLAGAPFHALVDAGLGEADGVDPITAAGSTEGLGLWIDQVIAELAEVRTLLAAGDTTRLAALAEAAERAWGAWLAPPEGEGGSDVYDQVREDISLSAMLFGRWRPPGRRGGG